MDLIESIDTYLDALEQQLTTGQTARQALLVELLRPPDMRKEWRQVTLSALLSKKLGGVWGKNFGESEIDVQVFRQTEFTNDGVLIKPAGATRSLTKKQLASRTLEEGDILIQKSAGTPTLPGRVVYVSEIGQEPSSFSNFLTLLRADRDEVVPKFLFYELWSLHRQGKAFEHQRGTNIRNLDLGNYLETEVLIPLSRSRDASWNSLIRSTPTSRHKANLPSKPKSLVKRSSQNY